MRAVDRIARYLKIIQTVQALPERLQFQVLAYVRALRVQLNRTDEIEREWTEGALDQALRGLDQEEEVEYSRADLKETFS